METKTTRIGMETEIDKTLKTLAETKATCYCLRETGQCDSDDCLACSKLSLYQQGVRNLLPVDLLKIDNLATKIIQRKLDNDISFRATSASRWKYFFNCLKWMAIVFLFTIFIPLAAAYFLCTYALDTKGAVYPIIDDETESKVFRVLNETHRNVYDMNNDHEVNCQDFTVMFVYLWAKIYPDDSRAAQIVFNRNFNTGMNHLFVSVQSGKKIFYIEPQGNSVCYRMEHFWGNKYNPGFNREITKSFWYKQMGLPYNGE